MPSDKSLGIYYEKVLYLEKIYFFYDLSIKLTFE